MSLRASFRGSPVSYSKEGSPPSSGSGSSPASISSKDRPQARQRYRGNVISTPGPPPTTGISETGSLDPDSDDTQDGCNHSKHAGDNPHLD